MNKEKEDILNQRMKELKEKGNTIYSFSRLGTYNDCPFSYKLSYIDKCKDGMNNIYAILGGAIHEGLEDIYDGKENKLLEKFNSTYEECIKNKLFFSSSQEKHDTMASNYLDNINNYIANFKKENGKSFTEYMFLLEIAGVYMVGYIDRITKDEEHKGIKIIDYKTSTKYKTSDLYKYGRQLVLYAMAVEQMTKYKVTKICWNMLKYANVEYLGTLKTRKKKNTLYERNKIIVTFKDEIIDALTIKGNDEDEAIDKYFDMLSNNTLSDEISDMFVISDGYLEYPYTEETKKDLIEYIESTVNKIKEDKVFKNKKIDSKSIFHCSNLCNFRNICPHLQKYFDKEETDSQEIEELEFDNLMD